jgi:hypothetical protein
VFDTLTSRRGGDCPSELRLTEHAAGELTQSEHARVAAHVARCAACRARLDELTDASYLARPEAVALQKELGRRAGARSRAPAWLAGALAAAGVLGLLARGALSPTALEGDGRSKGAEEALSVHVLHDGAVRRGADGDEVMAGDALRFATTSAAPCAFTLYGFDARGQLDRYARIAALAPGRERALESAVRLDGTLGEERFVALFCGALPEPSALEGAIRAARGRLSSYPGCRVRTLVLRKTEQP